MSRKGQRPSETLRGHPHLIAARQHQITVAPTEAPLKSRKGEKPQLPHDIHHEIPKIQARRIKYKSTADFRVLWMSCTPYVLLDFKV
jgi:hypothetical protein